MNQEKFLNSLNMLEQQMRARNPVGKDLLAREIFLNWEIDQQNRAFYRYKDPIELAHKYIKSAFGAPNPNIYELLCKVIDYVIMNPAWRPTYVLVDRVIDFQSSDFNY